MEIKMENYKAPFLVALLLAFLSFASTSARAQFLYDNGSGALGADGYGYYADTGNYYSESGDVFTAGVSGTAYVVDFSGIYYGGETPASDTFVLSLYSTIAGAPDTSISPITSTLSDVSRVVLGSGESQTVYQFSANLNTPFILTAGTSYFFGISDTTNPYQNFAVDVTTNPDASSDGYLLTSGGFVSAGGAPLAFDLAIPEPGEWGLIVMGGIGLIMAGRFLRRSPRSDTGSLS